MEVIIDVIDVLMDVSWKLSSMQSMYAWMNVMFSVMLMS